MEGTKNTEAGTTLRPQGAAANNPPAPPQPLRLRDFEEKALRDDKNVPAPASTSFALNLVEAFRAYWLVILSISLIIGFGCGYAVAAFSPITYKAVGEIMIRSVDKNSQDSFAVNTALAQTYQDVLTSNANYGRVSAKVGLSTQDIANHMSVTSSAGSLVYTVVFSSSNPDTAKKVLDEYKKTSAKTINTQFPSITAVSLNSADNVVSERKDWKKYAAAAFLASALILTLIAMPIRKHAIKRRLSKHARNTQQMINTGR